MSPKEIARPAIKSHVVGSRGLALAKALAGHLHGGRTGLRFGRCNRNAQPGNLSARRLICPSLMWTASICQQILIWKSGPYWKRKC